MSIQDEIAAGFKEVETIFDKSITYRGSEFPCVPGGLEDDQNLELGGFDTSQMMVATMRASVFNDANIPIKARVNFDGEEFRVKKISKDPHGAVVHLFLECPNEGI